MTEPLVGWHHGRTMLVTDLGHHAKRWRDVEPQVREMLTDDPDGDLTLLGWAVPDLLNEIDRLRFLLTERDRAEPVKPGMVADDCGWCRHHGYTAGQQLTYEGVPAEETR